MTSQQLVNTLVIGILLPFTFTRPAFLERQDQAAHVRRKWNFLYSYLAITAMSYGYCVANHFLPAVGHLPYGTRQTFAFAGIMVAALALMQHIPPVRMPTKLKQLFARAFVLVVGLVTGAMLAHFERLPAELRFAHVVPVMTPILVTLAVSYRYFRTDEGTQTPTTPEA